MDNSYLVFHNHFPFLSTNDITQLQQESVVVHLKKKDYWQNGTNRNKVAFIVKGAMRAYFTNEIGDEVTTILRTVGKTIVTPGAANAKYDKFYYSQAVIDTTLIEMQLPSLLSLSFQNERIFQFFFLNITSHMEALMERVENLITLKPEERVQYLLHHKHQLLDTIPHKYVANYIGITPVSLSRLLKKVAND